MGQAGDVSKSKTYSKSKEADPKQGQGLHEAWVLFFQLPVPSLPLQWPCCASLGTSGWNLGDDHRIRCT